MKKKEVKQPKEKLLPCPWCGEKPVLFRRGDYLEIKCIEWGCSANPRIKGCYYEDELRREWNSYKK